MSEDMPDVDHVIRHAVIDYGGGRADFWGHFDEATVQKLFMRHANQCFGIRKSIMRFKVIGLRECTALPEPWCRIADARIVLKHGGDTIVFGTDGEKLKSEWD